MKRITFVDSSRGMAVALAMLSHAYNQFGSGVPSMQSAWEIIGIFTRTATPTFVVLFGVMIEVVYLRKIRTGADFVAIQRRLLSRMLTCYLLFALITLAAVTTGKMIPERGIKAILYLSGGRFGVILKIYAALFFFIVLTLPFSVRYGSRFFIFVAVVAWALKFILTELSLPDKYILSFLTGHTKGFGPALFLSMTFVAYGVMIGEALTRYGNWLWCALIAIVLAFLGFLNLGPVEFVKYAAGSARWINDPYYYAYGIMASAVSLFFFSITWKVFPSEPKNISFSILGRDTLFYYGFGNILINLLPIYSGADPIGVIFIVGFIASLTMLTIHKDQFFYFLDCLTLKAGSRLVRHYRSASDQMVRQMSRFFPNPSPNRS